MSSGDWISACLLLIAVATLFWTARSAQSQAQSVRRQAQASDFDSYFQVTERITNAWRRFRDAEEGPKKDFEFTEILNLLESTCHLYNKGTIHGATREMIRDYLLEVLPKVFASEYGDERIEQAFSGPDTFFHIRRFSREHRLEGVPQQ